jgi:dsRNA-specific ribonuclease
MGVNEFSFQFKYALTHPSGAFLLHQNLGCNPDHIRNTLYSCRARNPNYGDLTPQKRKSLLRKKGIHMLFSIMSHKAHDNEESSRISNYERLEFLGDKILELLTRFYQSLLVVSQSFNLNYF